MLTEKLLAFLFVIACAIGIAIKFVLADRRARRLDRELLNRWAAIYGIEPWQPRESRRDFVRRLHNVAPVLRSRVLP